MNVADEAIAASRGRVVYSIDADIDHDGAFLQHLAGDEFGFADRRDENICRLDVHPQVLRPRVCNRYDGIRSRLFLQKYVGNRLTDDVASTHDDDVLACRIVPAPHQELLNPRRRARLKRRPANDHPADIDGVETVYILPGADRLEDLLFVDVFRERQLNKDSVNLRVVVKLVDLFKECLFGNRRGQLFRHGAKPYLLTSLSFHSHVDLRCGIFTDKDKRKPRRDASCRFEEFRSFLDFPLDLLSDLFSVDDLC